MIFSKRSGTSRDPMHRQRRFAILLVVLTLIGCAPVAVAPGLAPNAPHQQDDPRDTSGMH
jgi:hypothetical protein